MTKLNSVAIATSVLSPPRTKTAVYVHMRMWPRQIMTRCYRSRCLHRKINGESPLCSIIFPSQKAVSSLTEHSHRKARLASSDRRRTALVSRGGRDFASRSWLKVLKVVAAGFDRDHS